MKDKKSYPLLLFYLILMTHAFNSILVTSHQYLFFSGLVGLMLNFPVNYYGHVGLISSSNHTFFLGKLD